MMKIFTVSELVQEAKQALETMYPEVWVEGEITNANRHSSGHLYFGLKDAHAQIPAIMFQSDLLHLRFQPVNGLQVIVRGRLTLYPPQSRFQIVSHSMEPKGKGALQLAYEQLKAKLEKEGLFKPERKKPIPSIPQWMGVVTSPDGAALRDILSITGRRFPGLRVLIAPVQVQGQGAATDIAATIAFLNEHYRALDVLLVGRGGGSLEDLWAFNEETVARAIAASKIPVISCVGHETDFTIADFVADLRAPTPSAAAELVVRTRAELAETVGHLLSRLTTAMRSLLTEGSTRLHHAVTSRALTRPRELIEERLQELDLIQERLKRSIQNRWEAWAKDWQRLWEKLSVLSPLGILARGYAIAWKMPEKILLKTVRQVETGNAVQIQLREGTLDCEVQRTQV